MKKKQRPRAPTMKEITLDEFEREGPQRKGGDELEERRFFRTGQTFGIIIRDKDGHWASVALTQLPEGCYPTESIPPLHLNDIGVDPKDHPYVMPRMIMDLRAAMSTEMEAVSDLAFRIRRVEKAREESIASSDRLKAVIRT